MKKKKCKNCGTLFQPNKPLQAVCSFLCSIDYAKKLNDKKEAKEWKNRKSNMKKDLMTLSDWIKIAQSHFNHFIRLRDKDKPCISCGAKAGTYTITAGHYFPSTNKNVTFNEDNLNGQCWYNCNSSKSGNLSEYKIGLIERIGLERFEKLELESRKTRKFTIDEVKQIAETYKKKCKELKNI